MSPSIRLNTRKVRFVLLLAAVLVLASCRTDTATGPATTGETATGGESALSQRVSLTGAGASFPAPLYQNWAISLAQQEPNLQVNYQSIGSGAGIEQFTGETVDFGASDVAMTDEQMAAVTRGAILLPMTAGSIVMAYNLQGVETGLKLTREAYVGILSGKITNWNDPAIAEANPDVELPDRQITVVHRSDGSGTTGVLTKHLSEISQEWADTIGQGTAIEWPTTGNFVGNRGNEGVTAQIQNVNGAIGYIEYGFAANNGLAVKFGLNQGQAVAPSLGYVELPDIVREKVAAAADVMNPDYTITLQ